MDSQTIKWLVFDGKAENYPAWSTKFTAYMQTKGLYKALLGKEIVPEEIAPLAEDASNEQKAEWEAKVQVRNKQIEEINERNNTVWRNMSISSYKKVSILQQISPNYEHVYLIMIMVESKETKQKKIVQQLCILETYQVEIKVQTSQRETVLSADILVISPSNVVKEVQHFVQSARKRDIYQKHAEVQVNLINLQQKNPAHLHHILNV